MRNSKENSEISTIRVKKITKTRLDEVGRYSESADDILNRLIDYFEKHEKKKVIKNGSS